MPLFGFEGLPDAVYLSAFNNLLNMVEICMLAYIAAKFGRRNGE